MKTVMHPGAKKAAPHLKVPPAQRRTPTRTRIQTHLRRKETRPDPRWAEAENISLFCGWYLRAFDEQPHPRAISNNIMFECQYRKMVHCIIELSARLCPYWSLISPFPQSLLFSALWNSHFVQFVICTRSMNYASLSFYTPDLHLLTRFLTLLPPPSVTRIRYGSQLRCLTSLPFISPSCCFLSFSLTFLATSIVPSGHLMIPQVRANKASDGYNGVAFFNVFFFCCKPERSHCKSKSEWCVWFQIYMFCICVSESKDLNSSWRGFCFLCLGRLFHSELAQQRVFVHQRVCFVAHHHDGVSGAGEAQEGCLLAGSWWLWVRFLHYIKTSSVSSSPILRIGETNNQESPHKYLTLFC